MEAAVNLRVIDDQGWLDGLPVAPPTPFASDLHRRATRALYDPSVADCRESSERALKALLASGLVVETAQSQFSALAHHIASTLLNYSSHQGTPCPIQFKLQLPSASVSIPQRSTFLLWHLSSILSCNIFLFSSRSKPIHFIPATSATSSIAFFHRICSYTSVSEYLVLVPSAHVTCPSTDRDLQGPASFQSAIEPAKYRTGERRRQQREKQDDSVLTAPVCKRVFAKAL